MWEKNMIDKIVDVTYAFIMMNYIFSWKNI